MNKKVKSYVCAALFVALFVILDQWTKHLAVRYLKNKPPFVLLDQVFELHYLENRGAAFGLLQNQKVFFLISAVIILLLISILYCRIPETRRYFWLKGCAVWICSGAIGNMIDRCLNGYVVDFFYFRLIDFPIFNVADIYVTVAAFFMVFLTLFYYKEEELEQIFNRRK